jgi:hypothetical protein
MSSALFNMGQPVAIRPAATAHSQVHILLVHILLIADDTHVVGPPKAVIAAILDIRDRYAAIGLSLASTSSSKNVLYGLGKVYTDHILLVSLSGTKSGTLLMPRYPINYAGVTQQYVLVRPLPV